MVFGELNQELCEHILSMGGNLRGEVSQGEIGCCPFVAAVNKWVEIYGSMPHLISDAIQFKTTKDRAELANGIIRHMEHAIIELRNIAIVGLNFPEASCLIPDRKETQKHLTIAKK